MTSKQWRLIGWLGTSLLIALPGVVHSAPVAAPAAAKPATQTAAEAPMYGSQLMSEQERTALRARMWAAQSDAERERIRTEHHEEMRKRAQAQGVTLPETPQAMHGPSDAHPHRHGHTDQGHRHRGHPTGHMHPKAP